MIRILLGALMILSACSSTSYKGPVSDHFDGKRFYNAEPFEKRGFLDLLKWQFAGDRADWPKWVQNPPTQTQIFQQIPANQLSATFINHATVLLQFPSINILTDPIWSERCSPVQWAGPKRVRAPGLDFEKLPPIGLVVISHNHYDHLDINTLKRLSKEHKPMFLVPLGDKKLLESEGIENVREVDWGQSVTLHDQFEVTFTRSQHWSGRGLLDRFHSLWGSYVFRHPSAGIVYFAGDTGFGSHFSEVKSAFGGVDLALLPIGAYEPRWFMKDSHMNPEEAVQAHLDLGAKRSMAIHFNTFQLTDEGIDEPASELGKARIKMNVSDKEFMVMSEGQTYLHHQETE